MMTGTTRTTGTTATTEPDGSAPDRPAPRRQRRLTVRTRITIAVALLTGLGLGAAGFLIYVLGLQEARAGVRDAVDQEIAELVTFQEEGRNPRTGARFTSFEPLVRLFLQRNVPSPSEFMVGSWDGEVGTLYSASSRAEIRNDPTFSAAVLDRLESGGAVTLDLPDHGEVYLEVLPLESGAQRGAFAVAYFVDDEVASLDRTMRTYAVAALVALVVVTAVAAWVAGRLLAPVRSLRETAQEISETDLSRRLAVTGNDDLSELTQTFNAMLDRLDTAFRGQRAFVDDAGHELRTPLTILQGHLELLDPADPEEVARTRDLLLDESERMSRLVEDMILLTKAERPGFVVPAPTQVDELTDRVVDKVRALGDRRWSVDARADVVAEVDEQRLTQALVQLAQNAVKFTEPGGLVAIGSAVRGDHVTFWVRDDGPGVPDADKEAVFGRFHRGSTTPTEEGSGLGLSIVSAIATAHGGHVHVEDADRRGARFVITLPRTQQQQVHSQRKDAPWHAS